MSYVNITKLQNLSLKVKKSSMDKSQSRKASKSHMYLKKIEIIYTLKKVEKWKKNTLN